MSDENSQTQRKSLGTTNLEVFPLGFGSMGLRGSKTWGVRTVDDAQAEKILNQVLDSGINFIDTSPDYGICEARIGNFLQSRRNEFLLATKCGCDPVQHHDHLEIKHTWTPDRIRRNIEESLQRLRTDHLDLLQFHGPSAAEFDDDRLLNVLADYRSDGTVRHVGVSTKLPEIENLFELGIFDVFQLPFSCLNAEHGRVATKIHGSGAGVIIRGGIGQGGPDAEIQRSHLNSVWDCCRFDELLSEDMRPTELILRYTLSQAFCDVVIVGTANEQHLEQNVAAANLGPLPPELAEEIERRINDLLRA